MNDTIRISDQSIMYQGLQPAYVISRKKISYCQIQGVFENDAVHLEYNILMKKAYVKKCNIDLIKDNQLIVQRKKNDFFILLSVPAEEYVKDEEGKRFVSKKDKTADYEYSFYFRELDQKQVAKDTVEQNAKEVFNNILKEYGINTDGSSVADNYMKSWKIGHPDSE